MRFTVDVDDKIIAAIEKRHQDPVIVLMQAIIIEFRRKKLPRQPVTIEKLSEDLVPPYHRCS